MGVTVLIGQQRTACRDGARRLQVRVPFSVDIPYTDHGHLIITNQCISSSPQTHFAFGYPAKQSQIRVSPVARSDLADPACILRCTQRHKFSKATASTQRLSGFMTEGSGG